MSRELLAELLDRNDDHVAALANDAFDGQRDAQRPPVVSVCCSDSRVSQEGMWAVDRPGFLFTAGNIGNRVGVAVDGGHVLDGSVAYPLEYTDTGVLAVVGHTGCGAVGAALDAVRTGAYPEQPGVRADVEELVPIVEAGLDDPAVVDGNEDVSVRNRLVEHNVHEQVAFAVEDAGVDADVYGFVYDFHGAYGDRDGATYLVNANGDREIDALRELAGGKRADRVGSLLADD
ncbi:carbonic anhydrase [Halorubrum rubrum]|uniref:carbonic anhydrase n=1 Tax=Halorubrum rubrum TaxID=1126240 RepID=A0ABD5R2V8_9EURY|nr:carbonic anhydrase [Halorubrum rubrum]